MFEQGRGPAGEAPKQEHRWSGATRLLRRGEDGRIRELGVQVVGHVPAPAFDPTRRGYLFRRLLLASDALALLFAYGALAAVNAVAGRAPFALEETLLFIALVPAWVLLASGIGLYHLSERRVDQSIADELGPSFMVTTVWAWLFLVIDAAIKSGVVALLGPTVLWAAATLLVPGMRVVARRAARNRQSLRQAILLIGDSEDVDRVLRRVGRHPEWGLDPVAALRVDEREARWDELNGVKLNLPAGGNGHARPSTDELADAVRSAQVSRVLITGWSNTLSERTELIRQLAASGVCVDYISGEPEALCSTAVLHHLEGLPLLTIRPTSMTRVSRAGKRATDVAVSGIGLVVLAPLLAYVAIRIKLDSHGPVFFRQQRAGVDGRPFHVLKFRTMVAGADAQRQRMRGAEGNGGNGLFKLHDDPRVTRVGAKLRHWSIDELPQLWNVLRGEMSLVGPRPLPFDEATMARDYFAERLHVRPGITGPWQTHGRSDIPFDDMVKLDYTYVAGWTMREDLRLMIRTVGAVLQKRGAY